MQRILTPRTRFVWPFRAREAETCGVKCSKGAGSNSKSTVQRPFLVTLHVSAGFGEPPCKVQLTLKSLGVGLLSAPPGSPEGPATIFAVAGRIVRHGYPGTG